MNNKMKNKIRTAFLALFCLFPQAGMGMESIFEMQKGLDFTGSKDPIYYGSINDGPKTNYNEPPLENFLPIGDSAAESLMLIKDFPKETWQQIWYSFDDYFKFELSLISKKFYQTIGQSMHLHAYELKLRQILDGNRASKNKYRIYWECINPFNKLFICTKKIDALSVKAFLSEIQNRSKSLITAYEEDVRKLLTKLKDGMGDLSKNHADEEQYIYLCEIYNKDYVPKNCCERIGSSCEDCYYNARACLTWPCTQLQINRTDCYYGCGFFLAGTGICVCSPCILLCSPCICMFIASKMPKISFI